MLLLVLYSTCFKLKVVLKVALASAERLRPILNQSIRYFKQGHIQPRQSLPHGDRSLRLCRVWARENAVSHLEEKGGGRQSERFCLNSPLLWLF